MLPFGFIPEDVTFRVYGGANKAATSRQTAGFLPGEDVASVTLIVSNDIPAEVINREQADWIFHRALLLIYKVECCHAFGENAGINNCVLNCE